MLNKKTLIQARNMEEIKCFQDNGFAIKITI